MSAVSSPNLHENGDNHTYYLPRNPNESDRLELQHRMLEALFGYVIHPVLKSLPKVHNVLDIGTGNTIWLRDAHTAFPSARLVGIDISSEQFPNPAPPWISQLSLHNAVEPFSEEHIAAYDVVHQRLLVAALSRTQWEAELLNVFSVLKPGGWAQFVDADIFINESDLVSDSARLFQKTMALAANTADMNFYINADIVSLLRKAGFVNVETKVGPFRLGKDSHLPAHVQELGFANFDSAFRGSIKVMLRKGLPLDEELSSEQKIDLFVDQLMSDYRKNGGGYNYSVTIAQRPL